MPTPLLVPEYRYYFENKIRLYKKASKNKTANLCDNILYIISNNYLNYPQCAREKSLSDLIKSINIPSNKKIICQYNGDNFFKIRTTLRGMVSQIRGWYIGGGYSWQRPSIGDDYYTIGIKHLYEDFDEKYPAENIFADISDDNKEICIRHSPFLIDRFETSEHQKEMAVKINPYSIQYIKNPSYRVQEIAVSKMPSAILHIDKCDEEILILALMQNPLLISCVENPSTEALVIAKLCKNNLG